MSAVDDLIAQKSAPVTPAAPPSGSAVDALIASRKGGGSGGNAFVSGAGKVASGLGKALDAGRWGLAKIATHEDDPDKQQSIVRKAEGWDPAYQAAGKIPVVGHALQGTADTISEAANDPTFALQPAKVAGAVGGLGKIAFDVMDKTPYGRRLYDFLHFVPGSVVREQGPEAAHKIVAASNKGANTAMVLQHRMTNYFDRAVAPLTDSEKVDVGKALNGEIPISPRALSVKGFRAATQLRRLTEYDYAMRQKITSQNIFRTLTKEMNPADKAVIEKAMKEGKAPPPPLRDVEQDVIGGEVLPQRRVKEEYGDPVARQRFEREVQPHEIDLKEVYDAAMHGVSEDERAQLSQAISYAGSGSRQAFDALPKNLQQRAQTVLEASKAKLGGAGIGEFRQLDPARKFKMPHGNQAALDRAQRLHDTYNTIMGEVEKAIPRREDYLPLAHGVDDAEGYEGQTLSRVERPDPRQMERPDVKINNPEQIAAGFGAMAKNLGRQVDTKVLHDELGDLLDKPEIKKLFETYMPATGKYRTGIAGDWETIKDHWRAAVGYPRSAVVSLTPRHASNIMDLAINTIPAEHQPQFLKDTMGLAAQIMKTTGVIPGTKADPRKYALLTKEGRDLGALGGEFLERKPFFQKFHQAIPGIGGKQIPVLSQWTAANNALVWAIDEAAKQNYAKLLVSRGEAKGLEAGGKASARLVDYQNVSPMVKALRYVAPFGTFRGSVPGAVLGGVARRPAQASVLNRASGGVLYGDKPESGEPGVEASLPTAEIGRVFNWGTEGSGRRKFFDSGPANYVRGTLGAPAQAAAMGAQDVLAGPGGSNAHWAAYGQPWTPKRLKNGQEDLGFLIDSALAGIPEAGTALEAKGISRYQWQGMGREALRQLFGVSLR